MAAVRERNGVLQIDFIYQGVRCRESLRIPDTKTNRKYADQLAATIQFEISTGAFNYRVRFPRSKRARQFDDVAPSEDKVAVALDLWLESMHGILANSTYLDYRNIINNVLAPALGDVQLKSLSTQRVRAFLAGLDCGNKRKNNILIPLRRMLDEAFQDGRIEKNPVARIKNLPTQTHEPDPFSLEEITRILAGCRDPQIKNLFQFAFFSGLRTGELIALRWRDVDLTKQVVHVRQSFTKGQTKTPKTRSGTRTIKLLPLALEAIKDQQQHTRLADKTVFVNPFTGRKFSSDQKIREVFWRPALKLAGVRYRYPYQTRHTYACLMLTAGENPAWIANQMGHADWGMIRKVYARWMPDADPTAGDKAASFIDAGNQKPVCAKNAQTDKA